MKLLKVAIILLTSVILSAKSIDGGLHMPKNFRAVPISKAHILQKGESKLYCSKCGMTLPMFYKTNHAAKVNGKLKQYCSIYCLVEDMQDNNITDIQVIDNSSLKFIPAKDAWYSVGSSKPATMAAKISKYAFKTKEAADNFTDNFGGKVLSFKETLALAIKSYKKDTIAKKIRQANAIKKGAMIYKKICKPIDKKFKSIAEAKSYIKSSNLCRDIKGKQLQAVALYLVSK